MESFRTYLNRDEKPLIIFDGGTGTSFQNLNLTADDFGGKELEGCNENLVLSSPEVVEKVHNSFLEAGCHVIETNTFGASSIVLDEYDIADKAYEINKNAAFIAKKAAAKYSSVDKPRFVAGSIGPTNKTASMSPDVNDPGFRAITFDELVESYSEQIEALIDGGVDILLVETIFDTLNAKAALFAITGIFDKIGYELTVMVSGTITDASGRTLSGQTAEAFVTSVSHLPLLTIGFNCALGAELMLPYMKRVSRFSNFFTAAFPNAGLPNAFGEYDESSIEMGEKIKNFLDEDCVNIIGGCCGTTPEHIKVISELVKNYKPRKK